MRNTFYEIAGFRVWSKRAAEAIRDANQNAMYGGRPDEYETITERAQSGEDAFWEARLIGGYRRYSVRWRNQVIIGISTSPLHNHDPFVKSDPHVEKHGEYAYGFIYAKNIADVIEWAENYWDTAAEGADGE